MSHSCSRWNVEASLLGCTIQILPAGDAAPSFNLRLSFSALLSYADLGGRGIFTAQLGGDFPHYFA